MRVDPKGSKGRGSEEKTRERRKQRKRVVTL